MKKGYQNIIIEQNDAVVTVWLNREERHNALDPLMMRELMQYFESIEDDRQIRIVVLRGKGRSFCAGADIAWMKSAAHLSEEENLADSRLLSAFFSSIYKSRKITIALAHGSIFGGGNGIVAACDMAYGLNDSRFSLSETRLGLIAATISPYLLKRMKVHEYKELVLSARVFNGEEAARLGLLNKAFASEQLMEQHVEQLIQHILKGGPEAAFRSKQMINELSDPVLFPSLLDSIPEILASVRVSDEAKEGFSAFLEKRKPGWQ
jgi:methylglutaconyl-CoA hydratase